MEFELVVENAKLPERVSNYSATHKMFAAETITIDPNKAALIRTGVTAKGLKKDHALMIGLYGQFALERPVLLAAGFHVIDCTDEGNEIALVLFNRSMSIPFTIDEGECIAIAMETQYFAKEKKEVVKEDKEKVNIFDTMKSKLGVK